MITVNNKKIVINFNFTEDPFKGQCTLEFYEDGTLKNYHGTILTDEGPIGMFTSSRKDVNNVEMRTFKGDISKMELAILTIKKVVDDAIEQANK